MLHSVFQSRPYTRRQVKLSLTLPIALADFNASVQQTFKEQMALAAGLPKADSWRVTLAVRAARRRLLAGASVAVDVVINVPDATTARAAVIGPCSRSASQRSTRSWPPPACPRRRSR